MQTPKFYSAISSMPIKSFKISISDDKISRLKQKLALTDFPDDFDDAEPWAHGAPLFNVKQLASYWETQFDWRKVEANLNQFPQYTANIEVEGYDKYDVHYIHQSSTTATAITLLFIHSWPGSFVEGIKMLPELVKGGEDFPAFHVVAPSLIDFGFSSASKKVSTRPKRAYNQLRLV